MADKIVIGPINQGLRKDVKPFVIDNDNFPTLTNAYQWRGRVLRKRGTSQLTRLSRFFDSLSTKYNSGSTTITLSSGSGNILTGFTTLQSRAILVPGSIIIHDQTASVTYTDNGNGVLVGSPSGSGIINYITGAFTITGAASHVVDANFTYYPDLPVMGLEDYVDPSQPYPGTIAFDTTYSYRISTSFPYDPTNITFYKNPPTATYPGYVSKTTVTPFNWNGQDYQQFWTTNYQHAFWSTNGITVPFVTTNIGMQFKPIVAVTVISGGPPATANLQITGHGLVVGDFVFINEVVTTTGINFQTGYVITVTDANNIIVEFPNATIATNGTGGIAQYLTNNSSSTKDCIKWYDGTGWVNFSPPISQFPYPIDDEIEQQYYLVGARSILTFKDRLLFFGPVIQTSSPGVVPVYLQDTVIWSQNGTPYYTSSFTGDILNVGTVFTPILVPNLEAATPSAYWEDQTGFGGYKSAGIDQAITTVSPNEDALIVGFNNNIQTRLVYTGNDIVPFNFYIINAELGSGSVFSAVNMDEGVITKGPRGFIITSQSSCKRIDLNIPDQFAEISNQNNGAERFCSQRDFISEWIYFTYSTASTADKGSNSYVYPTQTLLYNYRDDSWAIFNESYTTYGTIRISDNLTWTTVGSRYSTWSEWNDSWNSGQSTPLQPKVIAGNQQGFIMAREEGTGEEPSLYIYAISGNNITVPNHSLNSGDFIQINNCIGTVSSEINGNIYQISVIDLNTINIGTTFVGTYLGGGTITRFYIPYIMSKQFPVSWGMSKKTRLGSQKYLFTRTNSAQVTLLIFLSQDDSNAWNNSPIVPNPSAINNGLIYSTVIYTCPESTNLGLTPSNTNLQQLTQIDASGNSVNSQEQIWHRLNTSLIGDTVQFAITMNNSQMYSVDVNGVPINATAEIEFHAAILDVSPSGELA